MESASAWLLLLALVALPLISITIVGRVVSARERAFFQRFRATLEAFGFSFGGPSTPEVWNAHGAWDGVGVSIELLREQVRRNNKTVTHVRRAVALTDPVPLADAAILTAQSRAALRSQGLSVVDLEPELHGSLRCFAVRPDELRRWLTPEARRALLSIPGLDAVRIEQGRLTLLLDEPAHSAEAVLMAVAWLAAVARSEPPRFDRIGPPVEANAGRWTSAAYGPVLLGLFLGLLTATLVPPVRPLLAPIVCPEGHDLEMVWTRTRRNKTTGNLHCVSRATRAVGQSHFLLPFALCFNGIYFPLTLVFLIRAGRGPAVPPVGQPRTTRETAYRG